MVENGLTRKEFLLGAAVFIGSLPPLARFLTRVEEQTWGGFEVGENIGGISKDISFVEIDSKIDNQIREKLESKGSLSGLKYIEIAGRLGDSILPIAWGEKPDGRTKWRASVWWQKDGKLVSMHNGDPKEGLMVVPLKPFIVDDVLTLGPDARSALFILPENSGWVLTTPFYPIWLDLKGDVYNDLKQGGFIPTGLED